MRNIPLKADNAGDTLPADRFNANLRNELQNVVLNADISLDPDGGPDTDVNMFGKSISAYANAGAMYQDSGSADAYVLSLGNNLQQPTKYYSGMKVTFKIGNTNTGASTINVNSLGVADLQEPDGSALTAQTLIAGQYLTAIYNLANTRFEVIVVIPLTGVAGDIVMTGRSSAPSGWLLCDGSAINRTTYAVLFAAIGTTFGVGDGSTTFNIPNLDGIGISGPGTQSINGRTKGGGSLGDQIEDSIESHTHTYVQPDAPTSDMSIAGAFTVNDRTSGIATSDHSGRTATNDETRTSSLVLNFVIKI